MDIKIAKLKLLILISLLIVIYIIPLKFIEERSFCIFYNLFKVKCYGCGFTRAFFNMTRFNIREAIEYNRMIIILGPIIVYVFAFEIWDSISIILMKRVESKSLIVKIKKM